MKKRNEVCDGPSFPTSISAAWTNPRKKWLSAIEKRLDYENRYAGHFHVEWNLDRVRILFEDFLELDPAYE
jgi:hypothetical protein